jgi:16S rRNA (uracil1498-N3)-methyltransferase
VKQFLLAARPDKDGLVRLGGKDYHYLVSVRRLKPGRTFAALLPPVDKGDFGNSGDFGESGDSGGFTNIEDSANSRRLVTVTVLNIDGHTLTGSTVHNPVIPDTAGGIPPIILFQGLPREAKMDLIVRQAAETGISEVVPFTTERSIPKEHFRMERWQRIIKEARQQSGSPIDTRIRPPLTMEELFAYWKELSMNSNPLNPNSSKASSPLGIVFNPGPEGKSGTNSFEKTDLEIEGLEKGGFHHYLSKEPSLTVLAVGPEGGLSAAELDCFMGAGFVPLSMGSTVLRTETAALYGAAAVRIILMEKAWWMLKQQ